MSRCLVVQHVRPEGPYAVGEGLEAAGVGVEICRTFAGDPLPANLSEIDGLVVMGGPMSAADDRGFPTRTQELALLGDALARGVPTLGICLGAQLLAVAAGGRVFPGLDGAEIGWGPVEATAATAEDPLLGGLTFPLVVLHWHGDTFDLPPGATHLASSPRYQHQGFRVGERAWGLQFHVEVDQAAVTAFLHAFGDEARVAGVAPETIGAATGAALRELAPSRKLITTRFAAVVAGTDHGPDQDRHRLAERS